jgi:hypothetical protein
MENWMTYVLIYFSGLLATSFVSGFMIPPNMGIGNGLFVIPALWPITVPMAIAALAGQSIRMWLYYRGRH